MLPAFPMDGGRIFRAVLSFFMDRVSATNIAVRTGQVIAALFFIVGIFYNPVLAIISTLIFLLAQTENDYVKAKSILGNYTVQDVILKNYFFLNPDDTISDAIKLILEKDAKKFLVVENNKVVGTIDKRKISEVIKGGRIDSRVGLSMNREVKFLNPHMPLDKVYVELTNSENSILPVVENGSLIGIVDVNTINEFIFLKNATIKDSKPVYKKMISVKTH
jgi:CBS domain-containing protein